MYHYSFSLQHDFRVFYDYLRSASGIIFSLRQKVGITFFFRVIELFITGKVVGIPNIYFGKLNFLKKDIKSITIFELYAFSICYLVKQL